MEELDLVQANSDDSSAAINLDEIIRCPRCYSPLQGLAGTKPQCTNSDCAYATEGFITVAGRPILIDFDRSIFSATAFTDGEGSVIARNYRGTSRTSFRRLINGFNRAARAKSFEFISRLSSSGRRPRVLILGGGTLGSGSEALYQTDAVELVSIDVYASPYTMIVADGHHLPFCDGSFDGVWIQAVLEHVLDPPVVVKEIYRVLRLGGLVYADTPFMQQVHEKAYDFTRFTLSGHRWLFRNFEQIDAGAVGGAGTASFWSARYLLRAMGLGDDIARLITLPLFWLRFLDRVAKLRPNADAASGVYFFGIKSNDVLAPKDMVSYYEGQLK